MLFRSYNFPNTDDQGNVIPGVAFNSYYGRQINAHARLVVDQLDDPLFPRKGYFFDLRVERSLRGGSNNELTDDNGNLAYSNANYTEVYGKGLIAASFGRHSFSASIEGGNDFGGSNQVNPYGFTLGGFQHLSAYGADQLAGSTMYYGQVTYMNQLATFNTSVIRGLFAGVSLEAGNVWNNSTSSNSLVGAGKGPLKLGATFFTSVTSSFGPIYLGVAVAPGGRYNFYFQLGHIY